MAFSLAERIPSAAGELDKEASASPSIPLTTKLFIGNTLLCHAAEAMLVTLRFRLISELGNCKAGTEVLQSCTLLRPRHSPKKSSHGQIIIYGTDRTIPRLFVVLKMGFISSSGAAQSRIFVSVSCKS
jgi:hypothetical protein